MKQQNRSYNTKGETAVGGIQVMVTLGGGVMGSFGRGESNVSQGEIRNNNSARVGGPLLKNLERKRDTGKREAQRGKKGI